MEESNYNLLISHIVFYWITEIDWNAVAQDSIWSRPYLFYEWETGVVNQVSEARKMDLCTPSTPSWYLLGAAGDGSEPRRSYKTPNPEFTCKKSHMWRNA